MQLDQGQRSVAPEQGERDRAQTSTPDPVGVVDHRREGLAVERRRSASSLPGQRRVERLAERLEFVGERPPLDAQLVELVVDPSDPAAHVVAAELEVEAGAAVEPGPHPVDEHAVAQELVEAVVTGVEHRRSSGVRYRGRP